MRPLGGPHPTAAAKGRGGESRRSRGAAPGRGCQFWKKETGSHPSEQRPGAPTHPAGAQPAPAGLRARPGGRTQGDAAWGFLSACSAETTAPVPALATDTPRPLLGDQGRAGAPPLPPDRAGRTEGCLGMCFPLPRPDQGPPRPLQSGSWRKRVASVPGEAVLLAPGRRRASPRHAFARLRVFSFSTGERRFPPGKKG